MNRVMTASEKKDLIETVKDTVDRDVMTADDYVQILDICQRACARRIAEIDEELKPEGPVQ